MIYSDIIMISTRYINNISLIDISKYRYFSMRIASKTYQNKGISHEERMETI